MAECPQLICSALSHTAQSSPPEGILTSGRPAMPPDLLREASRRLGIISLLVAVTWLLAASIGHLAFHASFPDNPRWMRLELADWIGVGAASVSVALFFY